MFIPRLMIAAALAIAGAGAGLAEPLSEEALSEIYESCVSDGAGSAPSASRATRMRYCYCLRDEVQRHFTTEQLAGARDRLAANALTDEDHERRERVNEACRAIVEAAPQ